MVEFALVLPVLILLMVLAIDFGRVFFGWVALNNAARIGANNVGLHPDGWTGTGDADIQAEYRRQVLRDLQAINCAPPAGSSWTTSDVPDPSFTDAAGNPLTADPGIGDHAMVSLSCRFALITPVAGVLLGNPLTMNTSSTFAIRGGVIDGVPVGTAPSPPPAGCTDAVVPLLEGKTVADARTLWESRFTGAFLPPADPSYDDDLVTMQTTTPATSPGDCAPLSTAVVVDHEPSTACPSGELRVPNLIGETVAAARTAWTAAGFTGSFLPSTGYDADLVDSQETSTGRDPGQCSIPSTLVTVGHSTPTAFCTAPNLSGLTYQQARQSWQALFSGPVDRIGSQQGNATVQSQSRVFGQDYPCDSGVTVTMG